MCEESIRKILEECPELAEEETFRKLLKELDMYQILKQKIEEGLPVLATCAGLILLAENLTNDRNIYFATLPAAVKRNGYGRQLGSFRTVQEMKGIGKISSYRLFRNSMACVSSTFCSISCTSLIWVRVLSRLCGEVFGSALTFGAAKKASAPGQMGVEDLKTVLSLLHKSL